MWQILNILKEIISASWTCEGNPLIDDRFFMHIDLLFLCSNLAQAVEQSITLPVNIEALIIDNFTGDSNLSPVANDIAQNLLVQM